MQSVGFDLVFGGGVDVAHAQTDWMNACLCKQINDPFLLLSLLNPPPVPR